MRSLFGAVALAAIAVTAVLIGTASAAKPPPPPNANGCPNGGTYLVDSDVGASFTGTTTRTYTFDSWVDKNPVAGVPGLVGYCVYTNQTAGAVTATATGDNGQLWKASKASQSFSFTRPGGEKSNIGLDGTTNIQIGTATFNTSPSSQTILLHVSDTAKCQALYGGDATTCFVLPGPKPGPICNAGAGNTDAAYNAIPTDVEHCSPPSLGFEAQQVNEFGDQVKLDTTRGTTLESMTVDFQSYGCETSGHWNTGNCVTPAVADTFTVPGGITAKIYDAATLTLIATSNVLNPDIPFRPSAISDASCPNPPADPNALDSRFKDPVSGNCNYSLSVPLTFTFPAGISFTSGQDVVWTVQFNTTHYGYTPIGEAQACFTPDPGCGYDSLNVGAKTYSADAFAGEDVDDDVAFISRGGNVLGPENGWAANRPLGQIVTGP
jgi:hypothetical protein